MVLLPWKGPEHHAGSVQWTWCDGYVGMVLLVWEGLNLRIGAVDLVCRVRRNGAVSLEKNLNLSISAVDLVYRVR